MAEEFESFREECSNIIHQIDGEHKDGMDEPDNDFVISKNFTGFRKKFKGVDIETQNLDSPISTAFSENDSEIWHTTSEKEFTVAPKLTKNSEVIWSNAGLYKNH